MLAKADFAECRACRCLDARREAQRLTRLYDGALRPLGLTINQFSLLSTLILAGPLSMQVLAERLGIDRTTLTRNLAVSEKAGLVRAEAGKDKRARIVTITPEGFARAGEALPLWQQAQARSGKA